MILKTVEAEGGNDHSVHFAGYGVKSYLNRKPGPGVHPQLRPGIVDY
jgi:hypothetical protein